MANSVTVKDIAQEAAVSIATVSRVFNNHSGITSEVRQRVLKVANDLGYRGTAGLSSQDFTYSQNLKELGFLYSSFLGPVNVAKNPFWSHILNGVEVEALKHNIKVTCRSISILHQQAPSSLLDNIARLRLGGILLVGPADINTVKALQTLELPMVLVDNHIRKPSIDSVLSDNFEGARDATDYLISEGHTRIAFIGGPVTEGPRPINKIYTNERRAAGYRTALLDAGLAVDYKLIEAADLSIEGSYAACNRLLGRDNNFSAIFCVNDFTAIGAIRALRDLGKRIPEDVSVVGFDDVDMAEHLTPALTTIRVNKEAMGVAAVKKLIARSADPHAPPETTILGVELIKRGSTCPPSII